MICNPCRVTHHQTDDIKLCHQSSQHLDIKCYSKLLASITSTSSHQILEQITLEYIHACYATEYPNHVCLKLNCSCMWAALPRNKLELSSIAPACKRYCIAKKIGIAPASYQNQNVKAFFVIQPKYVRKHATAAQMHTDRCRRLTNISANFLATFRPPWTWFTAVSKKAKPGKRNIQDLHSQANQ